MLKLHQRESCESSARVRRFLEAQEISYVAVPAVKLSSERQVLAALGTDEPTVPVLEDGDTVIQGVDAILGHLRSKHTSSAYGDPAYGLTRKLAGVSYSDAVPMAIEALKKEGFGVLTEIDVKATLKKKIDVDFRNYVILGACNPALAHKALSAEPGIGLLLPCNVVVTEEDDGSAVVSAIDPLQMFTVVNDPGIEPIALDVREKLARVMASLGTN